MAETERENIREAALERLYAASRTTPGDRPQQLVSMSSKAAFSSVVIVSS